MQWPVGSMGTCGWSAAESSATFGEEWKEMGAGPTQAGKGDKSDQSCIKPASHRAPHTNGHYRHTPWATWTSETTSGVP